MGRLFLAVLVIVVFEGALRKWVSPALTNPVVLLRDALALSAILWAIKARTLSLSKLGAQALLAWAVVVVVWGFAQTLANDSSITVLVVGIRYWILYLAFAYAAGVTLSEYDFRSIGRVLLITIVLMSPLVVLQHYLPPGAFLNRQVGGGEMGVFTIVPGIVRTTGTFTFTTGYTVFLAMTTPFVLSALGPGTWRERRRGLAFLALVCLLAATMVSGSRGAIVMLGALLASYALASLLLTRTMKFSSILRLAAVLALIAASVYAFPRAVTATETRFLDAGRSETFSGRVASMFLGEEASIYSDAPILGHGIGAGSNAAAVAETGRRAFLLAETETARTILEGGFLGVAFMLAKVLIVVVGVWKAVRMTRLSGSPLPLLLWLTTGVALLSWAVVGQLTINAIGYMLLGLAVASLRLTANSRPR